MAIASQAFKYNYVTIQSGSEGKPIDLSGHIEYIEYFENIMSPTISMNIKMVSTYNFVSQLPIRGGEMVSMEIETASGTFKFGSVSNSGIQEGSGELYVYKVESIDQPSTAMSFMLKLVSAEYFYNETSRCMKRYKSATIDTHVSDILENTMKVPLDRIGTIEPTKNSYSFIGNTKKPFHTIQWLCPKSIVSSQQGVSGEGTDAEAVGTAGFLFYENRDGFNFRSIEGLVSETREYMGNSNPKQQGSDIHGPYIHQGKGAIGSPYNLEENFKINYYHVNRMNDIRKALSVGQFANKTIFFDALSHKASIYDYKLPSKAENKLGNDDSDELPVPNDLRDLTSRLFVRVSDHGTLGIGTDGFETSGIDEAYQAKSASRYNALFSQSVDIQVPCNINLKVGDIINCIFPELKDGRSVQLDNQSSGNYLISRLNHHLQPNSSFTALNLIRDSYGYSQIKSSSMSSAPTTEVKKKYEINRDRQRRHRFI
jgi:hypothetical protein